MDDDQSRYVVSTDWVEKNLGAPQFRLVDASWYLPAQKRDAAAEYAEAHIPGAVFFDQDAIADHSTNLPHTIPDPAFFAIEVSKMGISDQDTIVVYDGPGLFSAPRVWFLFRLMGARNVYVMAGGMDAWKAEGRPVTSDLPEPQPATFAARMDLGKVTTLDAMRAIVGSGSTQIADARGAGRFTGDESEPRPGVRSGHMPGARNLPFGNLLRNGTLKPVSELKTVFEEAGIDLSRPVVTSCGSGVTAAVITLALESVGHSANTLYDGSWTEWGGRDDTPVVTGKE
ncbi:3-mercaptopyruvate sulfurtransferase [Rhizobium alvei]|uniref:3-mercaptopyruvate sulfurtransferase n=1 Tax=Rhizobium alvei TaxID=1132659 RepID=A0ABT8YK43_9HYPH|nr:3-mercaptopyruvate sulfurtransferase [Rhizobium alvei]MDO6963974.1 3-mercaptopyruvate sulfurtransferase [Rhizobium alvei]